MNRIQKWPSVVIHVTVKNAEGTIKKCVDSLLAVDYPNKEIYVTEAFSTDSTHEILRSYGNKIRLEQVSGNAPTAHNYVFKKIKSEFIAFTDADCVVEKNWLKNLIKTFTSDDIIAAGGFCKTPQSVNNLQRLIGIELESRFHKMPKYVSRLPTMNLCVRTSAVKKVKMDESLDVTFETDWGIRLVELGKMAYVPNAIVYHYHRSTWKSFFKQQLNYGRYVIKTPSVYVRSNKFGDYLSKPIMGLQVIIFDLLVISLITSLFSQVASEIPAILALGLLALYFVDLAEFVKNPFDSLSYILLFFIRNVAWLIGMVFGMFDLLRGK